MKYVLFYESTEAGRAKARDHFAAHRACWTEFTDRGALLMIGPFTDGGTGDAMAVFTTRAAAEEFAREDPFVRHGVVSRWSIREWNEALTGS